MWTLAFGHHEDRTPTHGYAATREAAMTGIRKKLAARMKEAPDVPGLRVTQRRKPRGMSL
jgi:hypothetical protein